MRTTVSLSNELFAAAKSLSGDRPFSDSASEAIQERVAQRHRERLAREMEAAYRAEAESSSLDSEWAATETEGM